MASTDSAARVAQLYFDNVFRHFGLQEKIISDRDGRFTSRFWQELHALLGTKLAMSTAFHPQTDGQTERTNRTIQETLRAYVNYKQDDWDLLLTAVEFSINNTRSRATGYTPFMLDTGRDPRTPSLAHIDSPVESVNQFLERLQGNITFARNKMIHEQQKVAERYNQRRTELQFNVGDQVLLQREHVLPIAMRDQPSKKLLPKFIGPYKVLEQVGTNAYKLDLPASLKIHPVINAERLKPFHPSPSDFASRGVDHPPSIEVNGKPEYEVDYILNKRTRAGRIEYLVAWAGYPLEDATWEPKSHLKNAAKVVAEFEASRVTPPRRENVASTRRKRNK
jgi:hypothetical protein